MSTSTVSSPLIPGGLLLFSGCCALVYQIAWIRELRLVFGASTAANAAVLAIFMGGLGLGGLLLGHRADRSARPLALYGMLELFVALSAAVSPWLVDGVRMIYATLGGTPVMGTGMGTVVRLLLSAVVLGIPTFLMGGTLPAVVRAVEHPADPHRRRLGLLYALNTLGSVGGALLATFVTLEAVGIRTSLWGAVAVNIGVALTAIVLGRRAPAHRGAATASTASAAPEGPAAPTALVLVAAGLAGFAFLLMELVWYRMLAPLLGGSSYSFGMILAVALLGIGLGGLVYGAWARRFRPTLMVFAGTAAIEAVLLAIPLALGDDFAMWCARLRPMGDASFGALVGVWGIIASAAILPAAIVSGFQFPLLVGLLGRGASRVGRQVGQAYACNTLGSILGSLAGGFGLVPLLGAVGAWQLVIVVLLVLALVSLLLSGSRARTPTLLVVLVLVVGLAMLSQPGPTAAWRHTPIGAGRFQPSPDPVTLANDLQRIRRGIVWEADGIESSIAMQDTTGYAFVIHGKVDGHVLGDVATNLWLGLLPTLFHPNPARIAVIGLGTGQTAGWAAASPDVDAVDVIELEPRLNVVAEACSVSNLDALSNPRLTVHHGDAREWLMSTPQVYDVIISEPSNPYRAGIASLFSVEFYQASSARLADDGLFLQWIQGYELSEETLATALATLRAVFSHVEIWEGASNGDLLLLASSSPVQHDAGLLASRLAAEPWRSGMAYGWRVGGLNGLYASYIGDTRLVDLLAEGAPLNTDDHPVIEFGFARHVGSEHSVTVDQIRQQAREARLSTLPLPAGVDPQARLEARHSKAIAGHAPPGVPPNMPPALEARMAARVAWASGALDQVNAHWSRQPAPAQSLLDHLILGESLADQGAPAAELHAQALAALQPTEAVLIQARLAHRRGALSDAVSLLRRGLYQAHSDPWVHPQVLNRALSLAQEVGAQGGPQAASLLLQPMLTPFAVGNLSESRRLTAYLMTPLAGIAEHCVATFGQLEPHVPLQQELLLNRVRCYTQHNSPLLPQAEADLSALLALE